MLATRRRLIVAGAVAAMLVGVFVQGAGSSADARDQAAGSLTSTVFGNIAPVGTAPVAIRVRPVDVTLLSATRSSKTRIAGLKLALVLGLVLAATAGWALSRPDRRLGVPLRRPASGASRAPPSIRST